MTRLDDYLAGEFAEFDRERKQIDGVIERTINVLEDLFRSEQLPSEDAKSARQGWPYEIMETKDRALEKWPDRVSSSTVAMISAALAAAAGRGKFSILSRHIDWQPEDPKREAADDHATLAKARQGLELLFVSAKEKHGSKWSFESSTFGADDVLTLCWLFDLYAAVQDLELSDESFVDQNASGEPSAAQSKDQSDELSRSKALEGAAGREAGSALNDEDKLAKIVRRVVAARPELCKLTPNELIDALFIEQGTDNEWNKKRSEHAFPLLRALQIKRWASDMLPKLATEDPLTSLASFTEARWQEEFSRRVHEQLSFNSIPDSRFDPAELVFALEGLALSRPEALDLSVVKRVLEVLSQEQERNPTLRPARPIKAKAAGDALFPVSVEIFNSLLRTGAVASRQFGSSAIRPHLVALCRRYYSWVRPRLVDGGPKKSKIYGWHSEHINDPSLVHPWETSQVLLFLLGYRTLVDEHLAINSATAAGLSIQEPKKKRSPDDIIKKWENLTRDREPISVNPPGEDNLSVYADIGKEFVKDHALGGPVNFSMILYGPPGTGKTGIAEALAEVLGYPLITVTVSDFLAEGGLQIEARAKGVFAALKAQKRTVIIFDEIDHLLLDRNSDDYKTVDGSIQLMVPGMLTKIKDLRSAQRSIFVIATNYEERIDNAIKRAGRIDSKYLVMPPDRSRRETIIKSILAEYYEKKRHIPGFKEEPDEKKRKAAAKEMDKFFETVSANQSVLHATRRMSYPEIRAGLNRVLGRIEATGDLATALQEKLVSALTGFKWPEPSAALDAYAGRRSSPELLREKQILEWIDKEVVLGNESELSGELRA